MKSVWINTNYFCGGVDVNDDGIITAAPPIIKWSIGKHYTKLKDFLERRRNLLAWEEIENEEPS